MIQHQIAERLEQAFSRQGFAEPSVAELRNCSGVSLRTLYRYFPSKESMVIGALAHRHARYLEFLASGAPAPGAESLRHLFARLAAWMSAYAPNGCLSGSAFAAFPNNAEIRDAVRQHKADMIRLLANRSGRPAIAEALFLLHEGASAAWPLLGDDAIRAATAAALKLLQEEPHD